MYGDELEFASRFAAASIKTTFAGPVLVWAEGCYCKEGGEKSANHLTVTVTLLIHCDIPSSKITKIHCPQTDPKITRNESLFSFQHRGVFFFFTP